MRADSLSAGLVRLNLGGPLISKLGGPPSLCPDAENGLMEYCAISRGRTTAIAFVMLCRMVTILVASGVVYSVADDQAGASLVVFSPLLRDDRGDVVYADLAFTITRELQDLLCCFCVGVCDHVAPFNASLYSDI